MPEVPQAFFSDAVNIMANNTTEEGINVFPGNKEENLMYLTFLERTIFFAVFLLILLVALVGNSAAIYVTIHRKHRSIQKTLIISLALSDMIMASAYSINHLETLSHHLLNWTLGEFMCGAIPFLQIFGVMASSAALAAIALDRYRNVVHVMKQRWNPGLPHCLFGMSIVWIISAVMSYPITTFFEHKKIYVIFASNSKLHYEALYMCLTFEKDSLKIYYLIIVATIFAPLLIIFTFLYYNIAKLVWKHRKPFNVKFQKKQETSIETVTSQIKTDDSISTIRVYPKPAMPSQKNVSVKRKIRTFKIIIVLMLAFFVCRIPYWTYNIMKLIHVYDQHYHWILSYVFYGCGLLNCALNPFLYTFLNETVEFISKIAKIFNDFVCQVCCCCFSNTEFEDFEKENPFIENCNNMSSKANRNSKVRFENDHEKKF